MFFNRKKEAEPVEEIATEIWACAEETCPGWSRKEFSFSDQPVCPFCSGEMISDTRVLPVLYDRIPNH